MTPRTGPATILLVEDNPDDVELAKIAMVEAGIDAEVAVVQDGADALRFLRGEPPFSGAGRPDLVLLDLNLPQLDGRELLSIVKQDPSLCTIPIVVLTTSVDRNDITASYRAHANAFLSKPADYDGFVRVLRALGDFWLGAAELPLDPG